MLRFSCFCLLSLALHLACGQLLAQSLGAASRPLAAAPAAVLSVQLLPWEPAPAAALLAVAPPPALRSLAKAAGQRPPAPRPAPIRRSAARPPALAKAAAPTTPSTAPLAPVAPPAAVTPREVFSSQPQFAQAPPAPVYPSQARRRNQQGVVVVEVRLGVRGEQRERRLLRSSGVSSLDQAALSAVAGWQFRAEVRDGQAVPSRVQIPIQFTLAASR
jgi:protein TonB